ncbi:MAG: DinB family protein [Chloroflexi bacterium]|nr:DinB family protein [Chloroflexota bacterium]MCI0579706.1 DinB family protein [Chloroflexota bacterium]MCI0644139.1 DinB family protein [Chloroflexota bacterium]
MTGEERQRKIESYGRAYETLVAALQEFPREIWQFRPAPDRWTIHEIVIHITDSEANSFIRCRRLIAEPGSTVMAYDENQWARGLDYHSRSTEEAVELFRWLRQSSYSLVRSLPEPVWANTIYHPENGQMTMDDWLDTYDRHIPDHVAQMRLVYADWLAQ